jgi:hypothetical protein
VSMVCSCEPSEAAVAKRRRNRPATEFDLGHGDGEDGGERPDESEDL